MSRISLDENVSATLEAEAQRTGSNPEDVAKVAILYYFEHVKREMELDDIAEKEFLKGDFISRDSMGSYMTALFNGENPEPPKADVSLW